MPQRNTLIFTPDKLEKVIQTIYRSRLIIAVIIAVLLFLSGCKKSSTTEAYPSPILILYFSDNILNRNFIVDKAIDNGTDITSQYDGYTFVLSRTDSYVEGPLTANKGTNNYTGTWTSNEDYSKLIINLNAPSIPTEFNFLNRTWKFTKKSIPVLELAPWINTDPKILHMKRV
ncbi:hypothetical protein LK994_14260 [Ferruginibacter lapsinanis]|uniref:hypothetical protein n=1 Tax=Ferruginibacter lapsinanis TaxID=563172 RepID=UPI001E2846EF|nr:hypothetical protein [Ferruginibacter lapsinanis]UEG49801.1 hypothetical protein LK994_14260 [Ferruginibacter lapsinanis]